MLSATPKRIIFMGSPAFAVPSLKALVEAGHTIVAVYTQPPRPAGRGKHLQKTDVHMLAESLNIPVFKPERLKGDALDALMATPADCICVVAYGLLLPRVVVENRTCLNVHPSALPKYRGPAPLQHALLNGETTTDICIMQLEASMDTGPIYSRIPFAIPADMSMGTLHDAAAAEGAAELVHVVETLETRTPEPQTGEPTLAPKITLETRQMNWEDTATRLHNRVRALSPAPGAVATLAGEQVKILQTTPVETSTPRVPGTIVQTSKQGIDVATGHGVLRILTLQRPGGKPLSAAQALNGWKDLTA
jgi:methionyl-tRNA formyltransferase